MEVRRPIVFAALVTALFAGAETAHAAGSPEVAALQVALRAHGAYSGTVDGERGPATEAAVRAFQRRAGLVVDGVAGAQTRAALGRYGRPELGSRRLERGAVGWDVAALQFTLAWRGFPSGELDGAFGAHLEAALLAFQRWAGLPEDGVAGPETLASLEQPPPRVDVRLARPVDAPVSDRFGPRGNRFHCGIDLPAPAGAPVSAAAAGRVVYADWLDGGWGYLVTVAHANGLRTLYAHLSRVDVRLGQDVTIGTRLGLVGATGHATGPHLHFELRLRGAAIDPFPLLVETYLVAR